MCYEIVTVFLLTFGLSVFDVVIVEIFVTKGIILIIMVILIFLKSVAFVVVLIIERLVFAGMFILCISFEVIIKKNEIYCKIEERTNRQISFEFSYGKKAENYSLDLSRNLLKDCSEDYLMRGFNVRKKLCKIIVENRYFKI